MSKKEDAAVWITNVKQLIQPLLGKYVTLKFSRFQFDDLEIESFEIVTQKSLGVIKPDKRPNPDGNGQYSPIIAVLLFKSGEQIRFVTEDVKVFAVRNGVLFRVNCIDPDDSFDVELLIQ